MITIKMMQRQIPRWKGSFRQVVNRLEALDSIEVARTIREALKR